MTVALVDLNEIKRLYTLAIDNITTYAVFSQDLISDMNYNPVVNRTSLDALAVAVYVPDKTPPVLNEFDLDLNSSELQLRFSETVNRDTLEVEGITIQYAANATHSSSLQSLQLTEASSSSDSPNSTQITIDIGKQDLDDLKRLTEVATSSNDTYLSLNSTAIADMSGNPVTPIPISLGIPVTLFTQDMINPELVAFGLDLNTGILTMTFSETVRAASLNISAITLQCSEIQQPLDIRILSEGLPPELSFSNSMDDPILEVNLGSDDLNAIKAIYQLATTPNNTYLTITEGAIFDMVGLDLVAVPPDSAIPAISYLEDTTEPFLTSFSLNLTSEVLTLTFNETVNVDSFNVTQLFIQSSPNISMAMAFLPLTDYRAVSTENSTVISFLLAQDDLNDLKLDTELATDLDNTWLQVFSSAVHDMALEPNYVQPTVIQVDSFEEDNVDPMLVSFVADLNRGLLVLQFDEPVNVTSLDYTSITLLSLRPSTVEENNTMFNASMESNNTVNSTSDLEISGTNFTLTGGSTNSTNSLLITLILDVDDLNSIKEDTQLLTSNKTTFISIKPSTIADMNGNPVQEITSAEALQAAMFISDETPPNFLGFDLDMDKGVLLLSFHETVNVSSTMFDHLVLQRGPNITSDKYQYMLTGGRLTMMDDGLTVSIEITLEDLNELKRRTIALTNSTTWIVIEEDAIFDMSDQGIVAVMNGMSVQVTTFIPDTTSPELISFELNLDIETLSLSFSETVNVGFNTSAFFNTSAITLQDTAEGTNNFNHFTLTTASYLNTSSPRDVLEVALGQDDLNVIKELIELATEENNTYISITSSLVRDMSGNAVKEINSTAALRATEVIVDATDPQLLSFDLDMDSRVLTLYFSETVNSSSLNVTSIFLVAGRNESFQSFQLDSSYTSPEVYNITIHISLSIRDFNAIKTLTSLATDRNDTFLTIASSAVVDTTGNNVSPIPLSNALQVQTYTQDNMGPMLLNFDLDMDGVILTLEFSETVNVSSIDFSAITIINLKEPFPDMYSLMSGKTLSDNGPVVHIQILETDEDNLKRIVGLATSENNTYISITYLMVSDMDNNPVDNITVSNPKLVRNFTTDATPPALEYFDLDLNSDTLTLVFTETVNASSLSIEQLTLQSDRNFTYNTTSFYSLVNSSFTSYNDPTVQVNLSRYDGNEIRRLSSLATEPNNTYLSFGEGTVLDMNSLPVVDIPPYNATQVNNFTADDIRPLLESFTIDLSEEVLSLFFSETVDISTFDATQLTLHGYSGSSYTLTGGLISINDNAPSISLSLTDVDLNTIKLDTSLVVSTDSTSITHTEALVRDMNSNPVIPILVPAGASGFKGDSIDPVLLSFLLDVDGGTLTLLFSESVDAGSLDVEQISLQSSANTTQSSFYLSSDSFTESVNGTIILLNISDSDLNLLKQMTDLATSNDTTFLSLTPSTIDDMSGNPVVEIPLANALQVAGFTTDTTSPQLESFVLDLDNEELLLTFSETVNVSSLDITAISLQSKVDSSAVSVMLTVANVSSVDSTDVTVFLLQDDLNALKSFTDLATMENNTYLSAPSSLLRDMFGNEFVEIASTSALKADAVLQDFTAPQLLAFDLDMDEGTLKFYFSESVSISSLEPTNVTLLSDETADASSTNYTLTGFSDVDDPTAELDDTIILFPLSEFDLNAVKSLIHLASSPNTTFISLTAGFITDQSDNTIVAINTTSALQVQDYTPDTTCPYLESFVFDLDSGTLSLTFSEPVNTSTFDPTMLTFLDQNTFPAGAEYTLSDEGYFANDLYVKDLSLVLSSYDLDRLKAMSDLASMQGNTFVLLSEYSVKDSASNYYCNDTLPKMADSVLPDNTPPSLTSFSLDMDLGTITLTFSEVVKIPLTATALTLLSSVPPAQMDMMLDVGNSTINETMNNMTTSTMMNDTTTNMTNGSTPVVTEPPTSDPFAGIDVYTLTLGMSSRNLTTQPNVIILTLDKSDLNEIKHRTLLATSTNSTYVSITSDLTSDYSNHPVVNISLFDPQRAEGFIADNTPPSVEGFDLDMDSQLLLTLTFSEVVNITSLNVEGITLQSTSTGGSSYSLKSSVSTNFKPLSLTVIDIGLSPDDANAIKKIRDLATLMSNTHLSVSSTLVKDTFDLPVVAINSTDARLVTSFNADGTPPLLLSFNLSLSTEVLTLVFDETIDASSVMPGRITIQADLTAPSPPSVMLQGGNVTLEDSTIIHIQLEDGDLHKIKRELDLATSANDTCISVLSMMAFDLANMPNFLEQTELCVDGFEADFVRPRLVGFGVNLNSGEIALNFDEPVDIGTVNLTALTLQEAMAAGVGVAEVTLTGGSVTSANGLQVIVNLTLDDLNLVKRELTLLSSLSSSYVRITPELVRDLNGNQVAEIPANDSLQASSYVNDSTRPSLLRFDLDMDSARLTLYFSETVDISSIDFTGIALQADSFATSPQYLTTGKLITTSDSPIVTLEIDNDDLNIMKTRGIGRDNETSWISMDNGTIMDVTGQAVIPVLNGVNSFMVTQYTTDSTPPKLNSFFLNLTAETLTLSFSETVNTIMTLDVTQITLTAGLNITSDNLTYTLTNASYSTSSSNLPEIIVRIHTTDLDEIKRREYLATSVNDTYLYISSSAVSDMFGNKVEEILPEDALQADDFISDSIRPNLIGFRLDMNSGIVTLTFDETVNSTSIDTGGFTFQSSSSDPVLQSYTLMYPHAAVSKPSNVIGVTLANEDLNQLKIREMLATGESNTHLSVTPVAIRDMTGNEVNMSLVLQALELTEDKTPPQLLRFTIDMDSGELTVYFDETVRSSTLLFDHLVLISNTTFIPTPPDPDDQHLLQSGAVLTGNLPSLTFQFSDEDLNEIKRQDMCTFALEETDCFLVYRMDAIQDMNMNYIEGCRDVQTP